MKILIQTISLLGLVLTVVPSFLVFYGVLTLAQHKILALIGSLLWIGTAPFWMNKEEKPV